MIEKRTHYPYGYKKAPLNSGAEIIVLHTLYEIRYHYLYSTIFATIVNNFLLNG